jgi:hypothetical protein
MQPENSTAINPAIFATIFQQNWENARYIKSERISFMNAYSLISAGAVSVLQIMRGEVPLQLSLMLLMCFFSVVGLLTSLRLKAELEECLGKLQALAGQMQVGEFVALEQSEGDLARYPKFRWIFPVFYATTTAGWVGLLVYRLVVGARN